MNDVVKQDLEALKPITDFFVNIGNKAVNFIQNNPNGIRGLLWLLLPLSFALLVFLYSIVKKIRESIRQRVVEANFRIEALKYYQAYENGYREGSRDEDKYKLGKQIAEQRRREAQAYLEKEKENRLVNIIAKGVHRGILRFWWWH